MSDALEVRVSVIGRASRRWRGARNAAEAERLNQALSDARARNLRPRVEEILRRELPGVRIQAPDQGLGSGQGFPLTGENNAAIDRSVLVTIDLVTKARGSKTEFRPRKIYAPSKYWTLKVLSMVSASGGLQIVHLRIQLEGSTTGRSLTLAGTLAGGNLPNPKNPFDFGNKSNPNEPVGKEVTFSTSQAEGFDYFAEGGQGQLVRLVHAGLGLIRKRETTFLQFVSLDTHPGSLVFEYEKGWSLPDVQLAAASGRLTPVGAVPSDFIDGSDMVDVPTESIRQYHDGVLISFPTGKAGWADLTAADHKLVTDFVTQKARAIAVLDAAGYRLAP